MSTTSRWPWPGCISTCAPCCPRKELADWHIAPDRGLTLDEAAGTALRGAYLDLLEPFEAALMPLRTGGAERLGPGAKAWVRGERALAGTYSLWLCDDPDASPRCSA
jgi:hypothetical protein